MWAEAFEEIVQALPAACRAVYGDRLKAVAIYGSVARGTMRPDSDIDVLIVADALAASRAARMDEFEQIDRLLADKISSARAAGVHTTVMPNLKTPAELRAGSLLYLDMTDQARILHDPEGILRGYLDDLAERLRAMGARRVPFGGGYYWELKPGFRWGDRIEI
jgi:predicted nucleotidyltransferase